MWPLPGRIGGAKERERSIETFELDNSIPLEHRKDIGGTAKKKEKVKSESVTRNLILQQLLLWATVCD
jgi:hypothetical protein